MAMKKYHSGRIRVSLQDCEMTYAEARDCDISKLNLMENCTLHPLINERIELLKFLDGRYIYGVEEQKDGSCRYTWLAPV